MNGPGRARHATSLATALTLTLTLTLAPALAACSGGDSAAPDLAATGAFIPEPASGDIAAGFFTIGNTGDADDTLTSVTSDIADSIELHETVNGTMRPVPSFPVPAGGHLRLSRGGSHLMLLGLTRRPTQGDTVTLRLHFAESAPLTLDVPVEPPTHTGEE